MNSEKMLKQMQLYIVEFVRNITSAIVLNNNENYTIKNVMPLRDMITEDLDVSGNMIKSIIMLNVTHWHSPQFHAYFPTANSYPSILADMLTGAIGCIGFTWIASPACTELEVVMMDWLGKLIGLPEPFLACSSGGTGGGVIQSLRLSVCLSIHPSVRLYVDQVLKATQRYFSSVANLVVAYGRNFQVISKILLRDVKIANKIIFRAEFHLKTPNALMNSEETVAKKLSSFFLVKENGEVPT
ncbi:unnamed protein product, partial [Meganyctiphanes norvegica]